MADSLYSGATDADLDALYKQLSGGVTEEEYRAAGVSAAGRPADFNYAKSYSANQAGQFYNRDTGQKTNDNGSRQSIYDRIALASPSAAIYHGLKNSKKQAAALKKQRAFDKAQTKAKNIYNEQRVQRMEQVRTELQRRQLKNKVNAYFNSDSMRGLYDTLENRHLENSLSQITQQYGDQLRQQSFATAGQGLVGSSVDAERRGDVQQGQNAAAIQAQGAAQQFAQSARDNNESQRQSLVNTISSGNPAEGAAFDQQIRSIGNQTQQLGQQYANTAANANINQAGYNMQSQALGNLLSNYSNLYRSGQQGAAYGGTGNSI